MSQDGLYTRPALAPRPRPSQQPPPKPLKKKPSSEAIVLQMPTDTSTSNSNNALTITSFPEPVVEQQSSLGVKGVLSTLVTSVTGASIDTASI